MKHKVTIERDEFGMARFRSDYKTAAQRKQEGKDKRNEFPRELHAEFQPASDRLDPVSVLKKSSEGRMDTPRPHTIRAYVKESLCLPPRIGIPHGHGYRDDINT